MTEVIVGTPDAKRMAMIAMTTINSIRVKAVKHLHFDAVREMKMGFASDSDPWFHGLRDGPHGIVSRVAEHKGAYLEWR